jgi:hypothetical protein
MGIIVKDIYNIHSSFAKKIRENSVSVIEIFIHFLCISVKNIIYTTGMVTWVLIARKEVLHDGKV